MSIFSQYCAHCSRQRRTASYSPPALSSVPSSSFCACTIAARAWASTALRTFSACVLIPCNSLSNEISSLKRTSATTPPPLPLPPEADCRAMARNSLSAPSARTFVDSMLGRLVSALAWVKRLRASAKCNRARGGRCWSSSSSAFWIATSPSHCARRQTSMEAIARRLHVSAISWMWPRRSLTRESMCTSVLVVCAASRNCWRHW
mmetsp:Transcript_95239/g.139063  ORF Transcript_95239/g.139063 Transcript_95239/m.139063 type:complete len:205 (-) Transcript_95239:1251-1865(-)